MGDQQAQGVNDGFVDEAETSTDTQKVADIGRARTGSGAKTWEGGATGSLKAVLVHNPEAGDGEMSGEELRNLMRHANISAFYQSSKIGELTAALSMPCDLIIVAGGDGTVAKAITQLQNRSVPIAILPFGTANNIATSFGIGGRVEDILGTLRNAERRRLDVGLAHGPWGCVRVIEGIGLGALVRSAQQLGKPDVEQDKRLKAAIKAIQREVKTQDPDRVRVFVDDEPLPQDHLLVEIMNIPRAGPRLSLAPQADPGDGLFDVLVLEPSRRKDMLRWLKAGDESKPPPFTTRRGRKIKFLWEGTPMHVDDDIPPLEESAATVSLEMEPDAVSILVPPASGKPGEISTRVT
jgi:diacylglycerol kinase (ATP)